MRYTERRLVEKFAVLILLAAFTLANARLEGLHTHARHARRRLEKRSPLDGILKPLEGITDLLPIVNKGLPVLAEVQNATVASACQELEGLVKDNLKVLYFSSVGFLGSIEHYMGSSAQIPVCVFRPTTERDVSIAISIIRKHRIEFAIAGGKHTGMPGFSSTQGLHVDARNMAHLRLSRDKSYIDLGPGLIWDDVYRYLEGSGRAVLGARASGIGVPGFLTGGGGYSFLTAQYGLASESLISVNVVLPNGTIVTASKQSRPDLFWAIKGGGNQFGIVTNFRMRTVPQTRCK